MPVTRIPVDVVMERIPLVNRWASERWQPATVVAVGVPSVDADIVAGRPQLLSQSDEGTQWCFPRCAIELHPTEAEGYYLNLSAPQPRVFVMWRFDDQATPPARPVVVTLSYNEAARMMDGGEQVDGVAMPPALEAMLAPYVDVHYKPEPRKKNRRNDPLDHDAHRRGRSEPSNGSSRS